MRRHAKAPSAGSTEGNGNSRGLLSRALATRGASRESRGSGARSIARQFSLTGLLALTVLAFTAFPALADTAPTATIDPAFSVSYTSAHLSGEVNPNGGPSPTYWQLQYSHDPASDGWSYGGGGEFTGAEAEATSPLPVSTDLTGLTPGTEYLIRLVATNEGGEGISAEPNPSFTTEAVSAPEVSLGSSSEVSGTAARFSGTINPKAPGGNPAAYDVNWHFHCVPDCTSTGGAITADSSPHAVTEKLTGLEPHTDYQVTLIASNAGGDAVAGPGSLTTLRVSPQVQTLSAGAVGVHAAALGARINPRNSPVDYQFEWGADGSYGSTTPAAPAALGASDHTFHFVTTPISGLQEGSTYHFRISATNTDTGETTHGVDRTFTTLSTAGSLSCSNEQRRTESNSLSLPDCRAYELVLPAVKDFPFGAAGGVSGDLTGIAASGGDAVAYNTSGPMPGASAGTLQNFNIARRSAGGWVTTPLSPPQNPVGGSTGYPVVQEFSEDLSEMAFLTESPTLTAGAAPGLANLYLRDTNTGSYRLISVVSGSHGLSPFLTFAGASDDFTHVVFEALDSLVPGAPGGGTASVYELVNGELRNVGIYPNGTPAPLAILGAGALGSHGRILNAVSDDGRRIVFSDARDLYVRIDGTSTKNLSVSRRTPEDPNGPARSLFWGASADSGRVFFTSAEELTEDANTGENESGSPADAGRDLYEYDLGSDKLTDLSVDTNPTDSATGAAVQGVVGNSDDGQYVYFVALGDLGGAAISGMPNLYVSHAKQVRFIATLDPSDRTVWGEWQDGELGVTSRVTKDGRNMIIQSVAPLTGYDNVDPSTGLATSQIYRYAAASDTLSCVSCRPNGTAPAGNATMTPPDDLLNVRRNITDNGRVFFDSTDAIVSGDTNGKSDVYEWADGAVHLISDGTRRFASFFQDASADGKDIFFATGAQLVGQDTDSHVDLYDAREGGGFARPAVAIPPCVGEACRGQLSASAAAEAPATSSFSGAPNSRPAGSKSRKNAQSKQRAKALRACKAKPHKQQRKKCESQVKKRFANKSGRGK